MQGGSQAEPGECPLLAEESNLIEVPTSIHGNAQPAVIDSGSSLNVVSDNCIRKYHLRVVPCRRRLIIRLANSSRVYPQYEVGLPITIGSKTYDVNCIVIPTFPYELLLGLDFITSAPVDILASQRKIVVGGDSFPIQDSFFRHLEGKLYAAKELRIPARSEARVPLKGLNLMNWETAVIEGADNTIEKYGVLLAGTLSEVRPGKHQQVVQGRLMNISEGDIVIPKGTLLGKASRVQSMDNLHPNLDISPTARLNNPDFDWDSLNICSSLPPERRQKLLRKLKEVGAEVFSQHEFDLGRTTLVKHSIDTGNAKPIRSAPYRVSHRERESLRNLITEFKQQGLVTDSTSPWAAPVVLVKKKDGGLRFCCDWRKLNAVTKKDSMPLPRLDDTLDRLANCTHFTKLDYTSGYYQVELDKESKEKSAFVTPDGLFQFSVMGMGLCNAPATFQRLMYTVLGALI